jgi:hypothetical protein
MLANTANPQYPSEVDVPQPSAALTVQVDAKGAQRFVTAETSPRRLVSDSASTTAVTGVAAPWTGLRSHRRSPAPPRWGRSNRR